MKEEEVEKTEALTLHEHAPHGHKPRNVNQYKRATASLNQIIAMSITNVMSSMLTFWLIVVWIVGWIILNSTVIHFDPLPFSLLLTLASIPQLPLMAVIMIGQQLLSKHQELQADEMFATTQHTLHDTEQVVQHLDKQDAELLRQTQVLIDLNEETLKQTQILISLSEKASTTLKTTQRKRVV